MGWGGGVEGVKGWRGGGVVGVEGVSHLVGIFCIANVRSLCHNLSAIAMVILHV